MLRSDEISEVPSIEQCKMADVYSFGMVVLEIFTGRIPFHEENPIEAVNLIFKKGLRPEKPENAEKIGLTNRIWEHLQSYWSEVPNERPTIEKVVEQWQEIVANAQKEEKWVTALLRRLRLITRTRHKKASSVDTSEHTVMKSEYKIMRKPICRKPSVSAS